MRFHIVCNSVSVIGNSDHGIPALFFGTYADLGALFGIFQSIINKVDNDLHDKLCVHTGKDQIVAPYRHLVSDGFFFKCETASLTTSSTSWSVSSSFRRPSFSRVTYSRFSTTPISHSESS